MAITLSPLVHIEIVVHNADAASDLLHRVFGATRTEESFSNYLEKMGGLKRIVHVELGGTILQLIEPGDYGSWGEQLKTSGPGIHNITYQVDNIQEAIAALAAEGCPLQSQLPIDLKLLLGDNTPTPSEPNACMIDTKNILGFRLELFHKPKSG
jgi:catechol 2,3-dioxygenase-like lactoylglutathione lyase family enzyme